MDAVEFLHRRGQYAESPRPELIMLDLKLPRKNGCEILEEIRLVPVLEEIPLVLLSSSKSELKHRILRAAARLLPGKPSTYQGFVDLVQAIEAFRCAAVDEK